MIGKHPNAFKSGDMSMQDVVDRLRYISDLSSHLQKDSSAEFAASQIADSVNQLLFRLEKQLGQATGPTKKTTPVAKQPSEQERLS